MVILINIWVGVPYLMLIATGILMNIPKENLIAIGDHVNDLDMFKAVGYKVAMGNAYDELKDKANFITKTNDEDGVMYALEHIEKEFL